MLIRLFGNVAAGSLGLYLLLISASAGAQPLADRVPSDAMLYIGWQGGSDLGPAYAGSHAKAVFDASKLGELFNDFVPKAIARIGQRDRNTADALKLVTGLGAPLWKYQTAIYFAGLDMSIPDRPMPKIAMICRAGAESATIEKKLQSLLVNAQRNPNAPPINAFSSGEFVGVSIGFANESAVIAGLAAESPKPLSGDAAFGAALKSAGGEPAVVAYLDVEKLGTLVDNIVALGVSRESQMYPVVKRATGLDGLKRIVFTGKFDGKDWLTQSFIEAPVPRSGLLSLLDVKPVSPELLKAIPDSSHFFATAKIDPARLLTETRKILANIDPSMPAKFDQAMGAAQMAVGRNLQTDVLEPLGEDWAIYTAPDVAGSGLLGLVIVNKLDDPKKAAGGLPALWSFLSSAMTMASKQAGNRDISVQGQSTKIGDLTVYYVGTPLISPAWAIKDGYLYLSLYPQNVASAAARMGAGKSIVENEAYQLLQKRLDVATAASVSFTDLPKTAGESYQSLLMVFRAVGFGDLFGVKAPEPLLPPLSVILPHLSPAGSASWVDDAGWHSKSVSPFPGSEFLGETGGASMLAIPSLGSSILLPSLGRARETANRVKCASNLRQIGQACLLYANENRGKYPGGIAEMITTQGLAAEVFVCPSTGHAAPRGVAPAAAAQWAQDNSDYVYVGKGLTTNAAAETVVCYEKMEDHASEGINILFGDGHVEFVQREQAKTLIPDLAGGL